MQSQFQSLFARLLPFLILGLLAILLSGCAGKKTAKMEPAFWPSPPDEPRIQFLTGFSSSKDFENKSSFSLVSLSGQDGIQKIDKPFGLAVTRNRIYVSDTPKGLVWIIDLEQKKMELLPGNYSLGKLSKPTNLAVDAEGNLYVADTARKEVMVYDAQGKFVISFGPRQGLSMKPVDVAVFGEQLFVADIDNSEIKVLDKRTGKLLDALQGDPNTPGDMVSIPLSLAVGANGVIHVTNLGTGRVIKLDRDGHLLDAFGGMGKNWGYFARPRGIDVDDEGRVFVVDAGHGNCQIFGPDNQLFLFFGDPGVPGASMTLPAAVAVTRENLDYFRPFADPDFELEALVFVTNQYSRRAKIGVYGLGHMKNWTQVPAPAPQAAKADEEKSR